MKKKLVASDREVFQIKARIIGSKPIIWRRFLISSDVTFYALHIALQDSFGWTDSHLHQFFTSSPYKRDPYEFIRLPFPDEWVCDDEIVHDESEMILGDFFKQEKQSLFYEYDFGDSWMHDIQLEKIIPYTDGKYPVFLGGKNACPLEDSGGLGGYYNLIGILNNPKDPEYKDMVEWVGLEYGEVFDPKVFDPSKVIFRDPKKEFKRYQEEIF